MTDHPMSCYPGHFEAWRPGEWLGIGMLYIPEEEGNNPYDAAEIRQIQGQDVIKVTDKAIYRMMGKQPHT